MHLGTGAEVAPLAIDWQDSEATLRWYELLLAECPQGQLLLWQDQAPHHTSEEVEEWLATQPRIPVSAFPKYTPEENPKEAERRTRWNSIKWVQSVASIHFLTGDPFTSMDSQVTLHIEWATTIRNRVAHNSDKARAQFKDVANRLLKRPAGTAIGRGFSPGQLLIAISLDTFPAPELDYDYQTWGDNFEAYISLFLEEARRIVPSA